jgi:long-chain acyl-CoA synthetase
MNPEAVLDPAHDPVACLLQRARDTPDAPWLVQPDNGVERRWTWAQAADEVRRVAAALAVFPPGSRIAISGRNTAHWVMADLAIMLAGHVPVGLYPRQALATTRYVLTHCDARAVFLGPAADAAATASAVPDGVRTIALPYADAPPAELDWNELLARHEPVRGHTAPPADRLAMILYTSGTSGMPKGVMLTWANIAFTARHALAHVFRPHGEQRLLSYLPLAHAQERLTCESLSLMVGAQIHFLERIEALGDALRQVAPTFFTGGPPVYQRMQAAILARVPQARLDRWLRVPILGRAFARMLRKKLGLHEVALCIVGGAPLPPGIAEWFARIGLDVRQGYGSTENCGYVALNLPGAARAGSAGRALPGAQVRIGADGEIQCRHAGTMVGYYHDPARTHDAFTADGYFRTGDAGEIDADGFLFVHGRLGDAIELAGGARVAPVGVEARFRCPLVEQRCLVGNSRAALWLLVVLNAAARRLPRDDAETALAAALAAANATAAAGERIAGVAVVADPWLPDNGFLTPTMKLRRSVIESATSGLVDRAVAGGGLIVWETPADSVPAGAAPTSAAA